MNNTKLGLDIGTNSIGWAILEKEDKKYHFLEKRDENGNVIPIPTKGSYIFPKGTEGSEKSKAATRRGYRSARRRIDRIRRRKIATLKVLSENGLCPPISKNELNNWRYSKKYPCDNKEFIEWQRTGKKGGDAKSERNKQPYYLRYLAATKEGLMNSEFSKYQLGRAFYHLVQRRGYKSVDDEEQTEDKVELFKATVNKLIEESSSCAAFYEPFLVVLDTFKSDKKVERLGKKILQKLKKEGSFEVVSEFIFEEFNKKENLGKVESGIQDLSQKMEESGQPTLGSYFYSIYAQKNDVGNIERIRGRYIDREKHYLHEFNYICEKQKIPEDLKGKLQFAIFYQRPLKSQKGLVAKCPLEPKRKRIAISHPLFEEFRMWETINRIKVKTENDARLRFLDKEEKELLVNEFQQKTDFEFEKLAKKLSQGKDFRYIKDRNKLLAEIEFNFPMDKTISACPTISQLKRILGKENYASFSLLNSGYKTEKEKSQVSIEDIWHCLFADSFGKKDKKEARKDFALKHLNISEEDAERFANIKLKKGYGNLSKSAIKKILPYLKDGEHYSHAVFLANISSVFDREPTKEEKQTIIDGIRESLKKHETEKTINAIVNNYIEKSKNGDFSLGRNENSILIHRDGIRSEIYSWYSEDELDQMEEDEFLKMENQCWLKFSEAATDKRIKDIEFIKSKTITAFIGEFLTQEFRNDTIKIEKLYHPSAMETYARVENKLGNPEISAIRNPVFNRAMHQIKHLVNKLIEEKLVDKDTEVNIEMAREINSASYRRALTQYQKEQEFIRKWAREKIIECYDENERDGIHPTEDQITKYILYSEQNHRCLYTNDTITPRKFFAEQRFDIEHTIPRSKINDNSLKNKTLADAEFNRNYKKDELPALLDVNFKGDQITGEIIIQNRDEYLKSYSISNNEVHFDVKLKSLKADLKKYKNAAKAVSDVNAHDDIMSKFYYTKLKYDYLYEKYLKFEMEEVTTKFTNANLVDTRLITKYARAYLKSYFKNVNVVNGQITDTLRKLWGLQGENEEKDRSNHIHHCIDAVTVACVEKGTVNRMSEAFHNYERDYFNGNSGARVFFPEPMKDFVATMKNLKDEVFIYHKQVDRIKPLLDEIKKEEPLKSNLRGALNKPNPYGLIKKDGQDIYVQRSLIKDIQDKDIPSIIDEMIKERIYDLKRQNGDVKIDKLKQDGIIILPEYSYTDKSGKVKTLQEMVLRKIRLRAYKQSQYPLKEIRKIDQSEKEYKRDIYVLKEKDSNYEARIFGDLVPDNPDGRTKFTRREYFLINSIDLVKNNISINPHYPFLFSIHAGDQFLVFNKHFEEIIWEDKKDLNQRLFKIKKFDEDQNIILQRNSHASAEKDTYANESNINDTSAFLLKKVPSSFRAIPTKVDELGRIDIEYSKEFIEKHLNK
ncbi:MAG: HNH endonuclease domain-containing protein [Draconibacterium sp.]